MEDNELVPTASVIPETMNSTNSTNVSSPLFTAKIVVQSLIFVLAIFGNGCLLCVMRMRKRNLTRMQIFIIHLCFADLLVAFFNILPQLIWEIVGHWVAGDIMCRFVKFMQIFVMYLSTYILVLTALDRRRAICNPLNSHTWTTRLVHLAVGFVYALSAVLSVPQAIIFKYQETSPGNGKMNCWVHFEPEWTLQFYITTFTALVYILPLIILIYSYVSIYYTILKRQKQSKTENERYFFRSAIKTDESVAPSDTDQKKDGVSRSTHECSKNIRTYVPRSNSYAGLTRAKMKTVKLTLVIIVAYIGCWSPFFISQLWWLYDEDAPASNKALVIMLLLASLNSCCNPWIYMAFSGSFSLRGGLQMCSCCGYRVTKNTVNKAYRYPLHHSTTKTTSIASTPVTPTTSKSIVNGMSFDTSVE